MDFQQRIKQMNDENNASHKAIMDKFKADAKAWGTGLKTKRLLERNTSHVMSLNRIQQNHDNQIEALNSGSQQRIDKYREDAQQRIEQARNDIPNMAEYDEPELLYEPEAVYEPDEVEDDIANELLNRMGDDE